MQPYLYLYLFIYIYFRGGGESKNNTLFFETRVNLSHIIQSRNVHFSYVKIIILNK
jgi:hypothetical protein